VQLLVQPGDGIGPLLRGIAGARRSVEIVIFRYDRRAVEMALADAVRRGVSVRALIARTNHGGEKSLDSLETRLVSAGAEVARTAGDLVRYHSKLIIVDRRELYVLAFNLTRLDIERSRSFGVVTEDPGFVQEAARLFEADACREPYVPTLPDFVVSPANARKRLAAFIGAARRQLLVYDPRIADREMIRLLGERSEAGVDVRIIGRIAHKGARLDTRKLAAMRLHTRTMIRDGQSVFVGSQSLRAVELDGRREAGIILHEPSAAGVLGRAFEEDWRQAGGADRRSLSAAEFGSQECQ
jgi:phosphatidylserine/phosphatidylglycerophosphate/cardiolipin synthase-like enzyme